MPRVGCEDNHAKSASAPVLRMGSAGSPRGDARAGRTARDSNAVDTRLRSRSRRHGVMSVKKSLSQRRGMERTSRSLRRPQCYVPQRARTPWAVCRFSTGRSARGPHGRGSKCYDHEALKPQPPPGAASEKKSLSQRRGVERTPRWPQRPPRQVRQRVRMLRGQLTGSPRGDVRAARAPRDSEAMATTFRSHSRRPGALSVKKLRPTA